MLIGEWVGEVVGSNVVDVVSIDGVVVRDLEPDVCGVEDATSEGDGVSVLVRRVCVKERVRAFLLGSDSEGVSPVSETVGLTVRVDVLTTVAVFVATCVGVCVGVGTTATPGADGHVGNTPLTHWRVRVRGSMVRLRVRGTTSAHWSDTLVPA